MVGYLAENRNIERAMNAGRWQSHINLCQKRGGENHYEENPHILIKPSLNKDITLFFWLWTKWASKDCARTHAHTMMRIIQQQMRFKRAMSGLIHHPSIAANIPFSWATFSQTVPHSVCLHFLFTFSDETLSWPAQQRFVSNTKEGENCSAKQTSLKWAQTLWAEIHVGNILSLIRWH